MAVLIVLFLLNVKSSAHRNTFKVGVLVPTSGNFALIGERMRNGFEMAKADLIQSGFDSSINIVYEDACQPKEAVAAVQKMIDIDKITLLGGSFCVAGFVPSIPLLEKAGMISFNTAPNPDSVLGKKYVVSTNSSIREKAEKIAQFAYHQLKGRTAAVIYYNTPLGHDYNTYLSKTFEKAGGKILLSEMTLIDATDFRTQLTKIRQLRPDVIFVVELAKPLGNLLKQARELGIDSAIIGNSQNEDPAVIEAAGDAAEGFIISSDEPFPKTPAILDFSSRYRAEYGQDADVFAANAYDALMIQATAFHKCINDSDCMLKEIHSIRDYPGVSGLITMSLDGSASKPTIFKKVANGKFIQIK